MRYQPARRRPERRPGCSTGPGRTCPPPHFGTHGSIGTDGRQVTLHDFRAHPAVTRETTGSAGRPLTDGGLAGHGDGARAAVAAFLTAVPTGDTGPIRSGPRESLQSHRVVWAAEHARRTNTTVTLSLPAQTASG